MKFGFLELFKKNRLRLFFYFSLLIFLSFILYAQPSSQNEEKVENDKIEAREEQKNIEEKTKLISLDVKDADIRDVMRMFSQVSGVNIIVSEGVKGKLTLSLTNVNWENALNMILRTNNLVSVREGKFLRIMTYDKFRREQENVPLVTETVFLNFVKAEEVIRLLEPLRSSRGRVVAHSTTNSLVITEIPEKIKEMMAVIKRIDKRTPQVMIEVLMVDIKLTSDDRLGINWSAVHKDIPERSITQSLGVGSAATGVIRYGKTLLSKATLSVTIDSLCQRGRAEILANPKVMTENGKPARINLVEEIPYLESTVTPTTGGVTQSYSFKEAGITLEVTPHINKESFVSIELKTEQSYQTGTTSTGQPVIDSREAETNLLVKDGETVVIGGLRKKETTHTVDSIPILGKIPLLGILFRKSLKTGSDTELLIFITPSIIKEAKLTFQEKREVDKFKKLERKLYKKEEKRMDFLDDAKPFSLRY